MESEGAILGVDVGGTFTDCVRYDVSKGSLRVAKVPTTPADQSVGLLRGIEALEVDGKDVLRVVHGSTTATNALIERRGATVGVVTTGGFEDVLELRRRDRPSTWGLRESFRPLVPRHLRIGVLERVSAHGCALVEPERGEVLDAVGRLRAQGADALVVSFLHSYAAPEHETRVAGWIRETWPDVNVTVGSEVLGEWREFERTSTAVVNAYVQPLVSRYLANLESVLSSRGLKCPLMIVRSNGGLMSSSDAARLPVHTILSGPAAGVAAAGAAARQHDIEVAISYDMGGTSLDVGLIRDGAVQLTRQRDLGFGIPIRLPQADIVAIGAGGGSIAWVDERGFLRAGPQSAGADPGPVCYSRGGTAPTVTDAQVVLGTIDAEMVLGSGAGVSLDRGAAMASFERLGRELGLDAMTAAEALLEVAHTAMVGALRSISVQRGIDPREVVLIPFGGGGPQHVCTMLRLLGAERAIIPPYPGVMSAIGCVTADPRHEVTQTLNVRLDQLDEHRLSGVMSEHAREGAEFLGSTPEATESSISMDMHYVGQTHSLSVPVPSNPTIADLRCSFDAAYRLRFGRTLENQINVETLRTSVVSRQQESRPEMVVTWDDHDVGSNRSRVIRHRGESLKVTILARGEIDRPVTGPVIIVELGSTIYVEPGFVCRPVRGSCLLIERMP